MRRDQLEHAIRAACQIIGHPAVIIVGSQAILASYREDELPVEATMSVEVDILPTGRDNAETGRLADIIERVAGEFSPLEEVTWCSARWLEDEPSKHPDIQSMAASPATVQ